MQRVRILIYICNFAPSVRMFTITHIKYYTSCKNIVCRVSVSKPVMRVNAFAVYYLIEDNTLYKLNLKGCPRASQDRRNSKSIFHVMLFSLYSKQIQNIISEPIKRGLNFEFFSIFRHKFKELLY